MKLIRCYTKGKNFNAMGCVKKRENLDRKIYFFNLGSAAFTMSYSASIRLKSAPQLWKKTAFFISGTSG